MTPAARKWTATAEALAPLIREHADGADRNARLSTEVVEAFHSSGLYRIFLPAEMGGAGLTIPDSLPIIESLARVDASTGWAFAISSGSPLFGMRLEESAFREIFSDPRAFIAGSLAPGARAIPVEGGYRFSGMATFASGAWDASWLQLGAVVFEGERPRIVNGAPQFLSGVMPISSVERLDTWNPAGMRGTGSIDCRVDNVFVPEGFTFGGLLATKRWDCGPSGNLPVPQQVGSPLAAVAIGAACGAIDAFIEMAATKTPIGAREPMANHPVIAAAVGEATGLVDAARATLHQAAADLWQRACDGGEFDDLFAAHSRLASVTAVRLSREAVSGLRIHAGTGATNLNNRFGRAWRDVDTICGHIVLSPPRLEIAGRALMGLPRVAPFI